MAKRKKARKRKTVTTRLVKVRVLSRQDEQTIQALIQEDKNLQVRIEKLDEEIRDHKRRVEALCASVVAELFRANLKRIAPDVGELMFLAKQVARTR